MQHHFEILVDTLLGYWLPPWKPKAATRQVRHSRFYFFDSGVARALGGRLAYPPTAEELGAVTTARRWTCCARRRPASPPSRIKISRRWEQRFNRGLRRVADALDRRGVTCWGVYLGERPARWDDVLVLPAMEFLKRLWDGGIIR